MTVNQQIQRLLCIAVWCTPVAASAQGAQNASLTDADIAVLYPLAQKVRVMSEICLADFPAQTSSVTAATAAWNDRHARAQLDSLIERTAKRRASMGRSMIRMMGAGLFGGDAAAGCANFAALIGSAENDLGVSNATALRAARAKLGAPALPSAEVVVENVVSGSGTQTSTDSGSAVAPPDRARAATPAEIMRARTRTGGAVAGEAEAPVRVPVAASAPTSVAQLLPPTGWSKTITTDGGTLFTVAKGDTGNATIAISNPLPLNGRTLEGALKSWVLAQLSRRLALRPDVNVDVGRTVRGHRAAWIDETPDFFNSRDGMRVVAIGVMHGSNAFTPVLLITADDQYQYFRVQQFGAWFASTALPGDTGPRWSPLTPPQPGPFQGLWFGTQLQNRLNIYGGMDLIAERTYIVMYRNGFAYQELPDAGQIDNLNAQQMCTKDLTDCGTYRVEQSRIIFDWYNQFGLVTTDTSDIEVPRADPVGFAFNGTQLAKVAPVKSERLSGEFTSIEGTSSGPNGSLSRSRSITFFADGRYEATRFVGFTSTPGGLSGDGGGVVGSVNSGPNSGTYEIRGYTLTMRPNQGPVRTSTIIFFDAERPVKSVLIDDEYYRK